ncbi:ScbA/BarX family gamma-butyrolactone biosynthesis protein [Streptomyces sp. SID8352]|uniref:ScbA/BarX family gamma-butyrolactone biosynthesis protein n=1 Tax=Streptomyces sp. SID8352 TaxID=2690338 RepID=UPI00137198FA|nr:gamma-butyrolactone biosynthesis enzyme [Streptomyces sp. SID8352]
MTVLIAAPIMSAHARPDTAQNRNEGVRVPRELVHRADASDVLITHFQQLSGPGAGADGTFRTSVQWPRAHALFSPVADGRENPMLIAETIRQAGTAVAHLAYDAPTDLHFLMWDLRYAVPAEVLRSGRSLAPTSAVVRALDVRRRGRRLASFHIQADLYRDDVLVGHGGASATLVTDAAYRRLRPARPAAARVPLPDPVPPVLVGRTGARDVLLAASGTPGSWLLRADLGHPVIFDGQSDHMPGRGLLEAMRQAAQLATGYDHVVVPSVDAEFCRYVELDRPCLVTAEVRAPLPDGSLPTWVTLTQDDEVAAVGVLLVRPSGAAS